MSLEVYLHDGNTEVGIDEGCGAPRLDGAELWGGKTFFHEKPLESQCR